MPSAARGEWELPKLVSTLKSEDSIDPDDTSPEFWDAKFYPYNPPGSIPIFAAVSNSIIHVCRLHRDRESHPCEIIRVIRDEDPEANNSGCCWTKDPETQRPWLCVAGNDAKIKIYDIVEGKLARTLVGHGSGINDLCTSPENPSIIASASEDFTVRIWSLLPQHANQPCVCLFGGEGHSWDLLSVSFHDTGRYLLSAGHDQVINLWVLPDIPDTLTDPIVVYYPHFSTSEIHSGLVDCVAFFGDLILSRACHEDTICLWRIEGFSSDDPPPTALQAPTTYDPSKQTRSAFLPVLSSARPIQYTRLLKFHTPDCGVQFFMRFRILNEPGKHPVLAFCNVRSKIMFWDLERLSAYSRFIETLNDLKRDKSVPLERPAWLQVKKLRKEAPAKGTAVSHLRSSFHAADKDSIASVSPDPEGASSGQPYSQKTLDEWAGLYDITNPHGALQPHRSIHATLANEELFVGRQVAWSSDGEWCVVVGNGNRIVICQRWAKEAKEKEKEKRSVSAAPAAQ